jgi:hypothetical protein
MAIADAKTPATFATRKEADMGRGFVNNFAQAEKVKVVRVCLTVQVIEIGQ